MVALKGDDEFLVVETVRVRGVEPNCGILAADTHVLVHHFLALRFRQRVPRTRFDEGIDEQILRGARLNDEALRVIGVGGKHVNRAPRHRQIAVGNRQVSAEVGAIQRGLELDQRVEVLGHLPQQEIGIAANAHQPVRPEQQPAVIALERLAELDLGRRLALGGQAPPARIQLVEGVTNDLAFFGFHLRHTANLTRERGEGRCTIRWTVTYLSLLPSPASPGGIS